MGSDRFLDLGDVARRLCLLSAWIPIAIGTGCGTGSPYAAHPLSALRRNEVSVVDLSHPLGSRTPYFPGGRPFQLVPLVVHEQGYYANSFTMGEHTGTHLDAAIHFVKGQPAVNEIPLGDLFCPLAVIDIQDRVAANPDTLLALQDVKQWEAIHDALPERSLVVARTGWERRAADLVEYRNQDYAGTMHFPGFSEEAATFLVRERDVLGIGIDTLSVDPGPSKTFPVHKILSQQGRFMLENLRNLSAVPPSGAWVIIAPLSIEGGSGSPVRLLALVPEGAMKGK